MRPGAADLFRKHHAVVYRYLRRMTGRPDVAEDLTQDVFLKVVTALPTYEERDRELPWLLAIARNIFLNHQRTASRRPEAPAAREDEVASGAPQLLGAALRESLERLPSADREALLLHEHGGLSYEEIAVVCGLTEPAVRSRIYRARLALRHDLSSQLEDVRSDEPGRHTRWGHG